MARSEITPSKFFTIRINGDTWKVFLYTANKFEKKYGACVGICEYLHAKKDLSISFMGPKVSKDTIAHELTHALLSYHNFARSSVDTMEEKVCEIIGKKYQFITKAVNRIYKRLHGE